METMEEQEFQPNQCAGLNLPLKEKRNEIPHSFPTQIDPSVSSIDLFTNMNQSESLGTNINSENEDVQAQDLNITNESYEIRALTSDDQMAETDKELSSVKKLHRQASPEEELVFQFGKAPKPSKYSTKILRAEKILGKETTLSHQTINSENSSQSKLKLNLETDVATKSSNLNKMIVNNDSSEKDFSKSLTQKTNSDLASEVKQNPDVNKDVALSKQQSCKNINSMVYPNLVEYESGLDALGRNEKSLQRLPSKKPRIRKPFPDVLSSSTYSNPVQKSNKLQHFDNSNFLKQDNFLKFSSTEVHTNENHVQSIENNLGRVDSFNYNLVTRPADLQKNGEKMSTDEMTEDSIFLSDESCENINEPKVNFDSVKSIFLQKSLNNTFQAHLTNNTNRQSTPATIHPSNFRQHPNLSSCSADPEDEYQINCCRVQDSDVNATKHKFSISTQALSKNHSRTEFRRGNNGKQMTRPLNPEDIEPMDVNYVSRLLGASGKKVLKSSKELVENNQTKMSNSPGSIASVAACKKIVESCNIFVDLAKDCEDKNNLIERQKHQIIELRNLANISKTKIKQLEIETIELKQKLEKFTDLYKKCKIHINQVDTSQTSIKEQGKDIIKRFSLIENLPKSLTLELGELKDEIQAANLRLENHRQELIKVTKETCGSNRNLAENSIKLENKNKASTEHIQSLEKENRKLQARIFELEADNEFQVVSVETLKAHNVELENLKIVTNERLRILNLTHQETLLESITNEKKLRDDITEINNDKCNIINDLKLEKLKVEGLEKEMANLQKYHHEIIDLIKQTPAEVIFELTKEESLISKIINLEAETQTKIDRFISDLKKNDEEQPASIEKLIEDFSSRLDISWKKQENSSSLLELMKNSFEGIKEELNHLHLNQETQQSTQARLNATISSLHQEKERQIKENSLIIDEKLQIEKELNEKTSKLIICEDNIRTKTTELNAAKALSEEDSILKARIQSLEIELKELASKLEESKQEVSSVKEKCKETCDCKEHKIEELEKLLSNSRRRIQDFENEKIEYIAQKELQNKILCQELTKKAELSKATMKLKLETEVKNLEQKIKEKVIELENSRIEVEKEKAKFLETRDECLKLRAANELKKNTSIEVHKDLDFFREQFARQAAQLEILDSYSLDPQTSNNLEGRLRFVLEDLSGLRSMFQTIKNENARLMNIFLSDRKTIEKFMANLNDGHSSNGIEVEEDISLQESLEMLERSLANPELQSRERLNPNTAERREERIHMIENKEKIATKLLNNDKQVAPDTLKKSDSVFQDVRFTGITKHQIVHPNKSTDLQTSAINLGRDQSFQTNPISLTSQNPIPEYPSLIQEGRLNINTPTDDANSHSNLNSDSNSSSLTDIEPIIEVLPFVYQQEELNQEYKKTRNLKEFGSDSCRIGSPVRSTDEKLIGSSLKHSLERTDSIETTLSQVTCVKAKSEPFTKRQKTKAKIPLPVSENPTRRRSGLQKSIKNSTRSFNGREVNSNSSTPIRKKDINFGTGSMDQSCNKQNQRAEPTESNVKQRRQDLSTCSFIGVDGERGIRFGASSAGICDQLSTKFTTSNFSKTRKTSAYEKN